MQELTPRQREIMVLRASGARHREIAHKLKISEATVVEHIQSVVRKLDAKNPQNALSLALSLGLIDYDDSEIDNKHKHESIRQYFDDQRILRDFVARQAVGHSDYDRFDEDDWEAFNANYKVVINDAIKRLEDE